MASLNRVELIGRLGQEVKLTYLPNGNSVAELSVATDESYKDQNGNKVERVEWHRVKVFGRSAEFCGKYLAKGRLVFVCGKLTTRSWEDQQGQKRYMTEVVVSGSQHSIQALDRVPEGQQGDNAGQPPRQNQGQGQPPRGNQNSGRQGQQGGQSQHNNPHGPAFPSEASGMDDVPF